MDHTLLDLMFDPLARTFSKSQTQQVLGWKLTADQEERLEYLRERANEGTISENEDREYKRLVEDLDVIAILQAKARLAQSAA